MEVLETDRLILRPWATDDLDDFFEYAKNENVGPSAGWEPHKDKDVSLRILNLFIQRNDVWAIVIKENNKAIGSLGVHCDEKRKGINAKMIGYVLAEEYWGRGLMSEAVKEAIKYLFVKESIDIISCFHYPFNFRSRRVIEKCGFKYEGTLRMASKLYDGTIQDDVCYSITRAEYFIDKGCI